MRAGPMMVGAFVSTSVTQTQVGAWMHGSADLGFLSAQYYVRIAQELERGGLDFMFFDDRLAMPSRYGSSFEETVRHGSRAVKLDPMIVLSALSTHTSRIGLGATYSTTYSSPYYVARAFATLDHLSGGRAMWNIVTSRNEDEACNFGVQLTSADARYDRAEEHVSLVTRLWDSWDDDALVLDRRTGLFADPKKVRALDYHGEHFESKGPATVPRPPQGWPTLIQAGQSGRGQEFAAKWADVIFTSQYDIDRAAAHYAAQKQLAAANGRDPEHVRILPAILPIVGETEDIARAKSDYLNTLLDPIESLVFLSEQANFDFASLPLDEPLSDEVLDSVPGVRGSVRGYIEAARAESGAEATLRDIALSKAGKSGTRFVGTPEQIADRLEQWFLAGACDGFVITAAEIPGSFEDFSRLVMPELRRRGLVADAGANDTKPLRARAGLEPRVRS